MRILDENNEEIQPEDVDYNLGHLEYDQLFVKHHDAVEASPEEGHYYPLKVYFEDGTKYEVDGEDENDSHIVPNEDGKTFEYVPEKREGPRDVRGMDVRWIVDKEQVDAKEAYDEYEDIQRYKLYTEEELRERAERENIAREKQLQQTQAVSFMSLMAAPMAISMTDEQVESIAVFMPEWNNENNYENGSVVKYNGVLYRAIVDITEPAQKLYTPDQYTAGWKRLGEGPNEEGIYPWSQPLGATDCYQLGDEVAYNGKTYESTIANNVWAPDVFGWKVAESSSEEGEESGGDTPTPEEYPKFVQPTGAHDAYSKGDKITYNGKHYESLMDGNVYSPDAYPAGWKEIA